MLDLCQNTPLMCYSGIRVEERERLQGGAFKADPAKRWVFVFLGFAARQPNPATDRIPASTPAQPLLFSGDMSQGVLISFRGTSLAFTIHRMDRSAVEVLRSVAVKT